ncbi:MAG: hypothetical protein JST87_03340 [Bacteroidetes bacterium]|nr:hypothetical protein [Bacteroidota bacterium]
MIKLLKLNPFVLFLILTIPWFISYFFELDDWIIWISVRIFSLVILLLWFLLLDQELMKRIPVKIQLSNTLFLVNIFLIFLSYSVLYIIGDAGKTYTVTGLAALPFLYYFYAFFQVFNHLSKLLTYVEEEKEVPLGKRIGEIVLFFFFFIGVFFLQPRIIEALEKPEVVRLKYQKFNNNK